MPKLYDRRNFLQTAAASLLAAPAILSNQNAIAAFQGKPTALTTPPPPLEVLYDTLGNATDGWGWAGQGGYTSTFQNSLALNYNVVTLYIGTLSTAKRIRMIEVAGGARNSATCQSLTPSYFNNKTWLRIWNSNTQSFWSDPLGGSVYSAILPVINLGDPETPVEPPLPCGSGRYVFGWGNLDIPLPANVPLQISLQFEGTQLGDTASVAGSSISGPNMLRASSSTGNATIGQPMATRITVSDLAPTAASVGISGRVVNKAGRGINGVRLTLVDAQNSRTTSSISNPFGYFRFTGLTAGGSYILSATAKRYTFRQYPQVFQLLEDVTDLRIIADEIEKIRIRV